MLRRPGPVAFHSGEPCSTCGFRYSMDELHRHYTKGEDSWHRLRLQGTDGKRITVWADQHGRVVPCWWPLPLLTMRLDVDAATLRLWVAHQYVRRLDTMRTLRED